MAFESLQQRQLTRAGCAAVPAPTCVHIHARGAVSRRSHSTSKVLKSISNLQNRCRQQLCVQARKQDWRSSSSSNRSKQQDKAFRFKFNNIDVALAEDELWRLAVPFAAIFGMAVLIGPLVVGITLSAIAVGAAFSTGALFFTTLLLPLIVLSGIGGILSLAVGAAFVIPNMLFSLLSVGFVGGGLLLGYTGINWLLSKQSSASKAPGSSRAGDTIIEVEDSKGENKLFDIEQDVKRAASELREFDEILARKEERRRVDEWRERSRY